MQVKTTEKADKELLKFPNEIRRRFFKYFRDFAKGEILTTKVLKKLSGHELYEFRVKGESGIYRALAGKINPNLIIVLFFHKKSQKTPTQLIQTAERRLKSITF
jgi:phage-related protein